jgi:hypothetical protein
VSLGQLMKELLWSALVSMSLGMCVAAACGRSSNGAWRDWVDAIDIRDRMPVRIEAGMESVGFRRE